MSCRGAEVQSQMHEKDPQHSESAAVLSNVMCNQRQTRQGCCLSRALTRGPYLIPNCTALKEDRGRLCVVAVGWLERSAERCQVCGSLQDWRGNFGVLAEGEDLNALR